MPVTFEYPLLVCCGSIVNICIESHSEESLVWRFIINLVSLKGIPSDMCAYVCDNALFWVEEAKVYLGSQLHVASSIKSTCQSRNYVSSCLSPVALFTSI